MLKRAIATGLLACLPLVALAQQGDRANPGARLISPPSTQAPAPPEAPKPPIAKEMTPDDAGQSRAEKATPPPSAPGDNRGTEQAPLAVRIMPVPQTAAELAQEAAARQERAASDLRLTLLTAAMGAIAVLQLFALIVFIGTTRRHQRAYVFVSGAEIIDLEIGGVPIVQIELKNTGQTPAYQLTHVWRCGVHDHPLQHKLLLPHNNDPISWPHLGPGASVKAQRAAEKQIAGGAPGELINRATAFYVYGEILYKDAFNKARFTRYVLFHTGLPRMGPGQLVAYEKGNEAN